MTDGTFSLDDLSRLTGLSTRAIRDYIARGLVPPSQGLGRAAGYSNEHLERLLALKALRSRGRGLAEIDSVLAAGDDAQLRALADAGRDEVESGQLTSPLHYIRSIPPGGRPTQTRAASRPSPPSMGQALVVLAEQLRQISINLPAPSSRAQEWLRVRVTPDFEIGVRGPLDAVARIALERVADALRSLIESP